MSKRQKNPRRMKAVMAGLIAVFLAIFIYPDKSGAEPLTFRKLWRAHPLNNSVTFPARMLVNVTAGDKVIRRGTPSFANQCAIRMGVALRDAGVTIDQLGNIRVSWYHPRDSMYVLVAQELANALVSNNIPGLGPVEKLSDPKNFHKTLYGRTGIIFFKDYWRRTGETTPTGDHIDVWNGYRTSAKWLMEWFSWLGYTENYGKSREIWFWEVK